MSIWFLIVSLILLLGVAGIIVPNGQLGRFERDRRKHEGGEDVDRELYYADVISLKHVLEMTVLIVSVLLAVVSFGWFWGVVAALLIGLLYRIMAKQAIVRSAAMYVYNKCEGHIITFIKRYPWVISKLRIVTAESPEVIVHSRDELQHLIKTAPNIITKDETKRLLHVLDFASHTVRETMTPRSVIDSVKKTEILGPLVLDDLHKTGHSRFPVIDGDLDHVVGILHLRDALTLDTSRKHTAKVETAMEQKVYYIHEDQALDHALAAFLKTHHHLFVVVNEYRETTGLITLEDTIEKLLGDSIVDEFDAHDDLRAVAERNPRGLNKTEHSTTV